MSASRLFQIVYLLLERGKITAEMLAQRLEVSVRTIYRDIDALSAAGVPVYTSPGRSGGISLLEGWVLDRAAFSRPEQERLIAALQSMPDAARPENQAVLDKLSGLFGLPSPGWLQVDLSGWGTPPLQPDLRFDQLKQAILGGYTVTFTYISTSKPPERRAIRPARLVFKTRAWYLQGWCLDRCAFRTFRLSRILDLEVTGDQFELLLSPPPIGFPEHLIPNSTVRLRFSPLAAYRAYDEFDLSCASREQDGALVVETLLPADRWLCGYLLSFGAEVEVLSPPGLRRQMERLSREVLQIYKKPDTGCQDK